MSIHSTCLTQVPAILNRKTYCDDILPELQSVQIATQFIPRLAVTSNLRANSTVHNSAEAICFKF